MGGVGAGVPPGQGRGDELAAQVAGFTVFESGVAGGEFRFFLQRGGQDDGHPF